MVPAVHDRLTCWLNANAPAIDSVSCCPRHVDISLTERQAIQILDTCSMVRWRATEKGGGGSRGVKAARSEGLSWRHCSSPEEDCRNRTETGDLETTTPFFYCLSTRADVEGFASLFSETLHAFELAGARDGARYGSHCR